MRIDENTRTPCGHEDTVSSPVDNVSTPELPSFAPTNQYNQFKWGEIDVEKIAADIDSIYTQIVHWKHNLFKVPSGKYGKVFVQELACLFNVYGEASAIEGVALKAAMIFPALVLQKPFKLSKSRDHVSCIERRMKEWRDESGAMILPLDRMIDGKPVRDVLREKHPVSRPLHPATLLQQEEEAKAPPHHPMMFDEINGLCILKSALKTEGGAGPSAVDASLCRQCLN